MLREDILPMTSTRSRTVSYHDPQAAANARPQRHHSRRPSRSRTRFLSLPPDSIQEEAILSRRQHRTSAHYSSQSCLSQVITEEEDIGPVTKFGWHEKKIICCIAAANLMYGCIIGLFIPFFPTEAAARNIPQVLIGGMFSVYAFTIFLASSAASKMIPRIGASRLFQIGLSMAGVSTVLFGLLDRMPSATGFIITCYMMRVIEALGTAAFYTSAYTIVANQFPGNVNLLVGTAETMCAIGIASGPALGGGLYSVGGYGLPFFVAGGLILLLTMFSCCVMPSIGGDEEKVQVRAFSMILVRSAEAWLNVITITCLAIGWTAMDPGLAPYVDDAIGVTPGHLGLYFLLASGTYALVGPLWGKICDRVSNNYVQMSFCLLLAAIGLSLISPELVWRAAPQQGLVAVGLTMRQLFLGGTFIPTFGNLLRAGRQAGLPAGLATQAFLSGVMSTAFSIGNMAGPLLAGVVNDNYGFPTTALCLTVGAVCLSSVIALQAVRRWRQLAGEKNSGASEKLTQKPDGSEAPTVKIEQAAAPTEKTPLLQNEVTPDNT